MTAEEIISQYHQIEYQSTMQDKGWYKLSDMFSFVFPIEGDLQAVALDTGGEVGRMEHAKIDDNKLYLKDFDTQEWRAITDIRMTESDNPSANTLGIMAVGMPIKIEIEKM